MLYSCRLGRTGVWAGRYPALLTVEHVKAVLQAMQHSSAAWFNSFYYAAACRL